MRGSKHNDEVREKAFALLATGESVAKTAKTLKLSYSTVRTWERDWKAKVRKDNADGGAKEPEKNVQEGSAGAGDGVHDSDKTLEELKRDRHQKFIKRSWGIIEDAQTIIERRLKRAVHKENVLDEILKMVEDNKKLSDEQKQKLFRRLEGLRLDDVRALSSILATAYDKQALASGDSTLNIDGGIRFEDL